MRRDTSERVFESFADKVSKFDEKVKKHLRSQSTNPFSGSFQPDILPRFSAAECARHVRCSKSEQRGQKAQSHVCREMMELCEIIYDMSQYRNRQRKSRNCQPELIKISPVVRFGDLFQRRDDDVLITLTKSIGEIRKILT